MLLYKLTYFTTGDVLCNSPLSLHLHVMLHSRQFLNWTSFGPPVKTVFQAKLNHTNNHEEQNIALWGK
jgi:hypothetical protein